MPEQKKVVENGITTYYDYTLHGKLITHLTKRVVDMDGVETSDELHFFYDAQSRPSFVEYNGEMYRYIHNLQGDIIGIVDAAGNLVVEYKYDAWGKPVSTIGSLANTLADLNPFRYRGYVYDEETGLYYLRSRYYNPVWGRFINSDALLGKVGAVGSHNLFAYCGNNPVAMVDPNGNVASTAIAGAKIGSKFGIKGVIIGFIIGFIIGCAAHIAKNPPRISIESSVTPIPASSASLKATTEADLLSALSSVKAVRADQFENHYSYNYYFAFCKNVNENSFLYIIPIALNMGQAATIVTSGSIVNELMNAHGGNGAYGIYTPFYEGAAALEAAIGGFEGKEEIHGNTPNANPGQYFWHFHNASHDYHIWFGAPMNVGVG